MIACNICDIKLFTKKLFIGETFDRFLLKEAEIVTFNTFSIDDASIKAFIPKKSVPRGRLKNIQPGKLCARSVFPS